MGTQKQFCYLVWCTPGPSSVPFLKRYHLCLFTIILRYSRSGQQPITGYPFKRYHLCLFTIILHHSRSGQQPITGYPFKRYHLCLFTIILHHSRTGQQPIIGYPFNYVFICRKIHDQLPPGLVAQLVEQRRSVLFVCARPFPF